MTSRPKVLYIEDDVSSALLVRSVLEAAGYRVVLAPDGFRGLETTLRERPDLILLDIQLPDVDGCTLAAILKSFPRFAATPVVAVTAWPAEEERQRMLVAGCEGFICKPIDVDHFPGQIEEFLRGKRERPAEKEEGFHLRALNQRLVYRLLDQLEEVRRLNRLAMQRASQLEQIHRSLQDLTSELGTVTVLERLLPTLARALGLAELVVELNHPPGTRVAAGGEPGPAAPPLAEVEWKQPLAVRGEPLGFIAARRLQPPGALPPDEPLFRLVANHVAIAVENCRLWEAEHAARRRADFLARASQALTASLDYETTLGQVAALAVPELACVAFVDAVEEAHALRRLAVAGGPGIADELLTALRSCPPSPGSTHPVAEALRARQPRIVPEVSDALLAAMARDPEHLALLRRLGPQSMMVVPLVARGRTLGALTLVSTDPGRRYGPADLALAEELTARAALAIDNARLYGEAQEADRRKDRFLATLAHELRTPLAPILNATGILRMHEQDAPLLRRAREIIERQVRYQARLLDDLLDLARISQDKIELRRSAVDLTALVADVAEALRPAVEDRGQRLSLTGATDPVVLAADPTRLEQIVTNLLQNAIKYTPSGGEIAVTVERAGDWAVLRVRDTGIGIAPQMLERVFDLFMQVKSSGARAATGGLGIGLALVRRLVELHGGTIEARSEGPGRGAEFTVRLPLAGGREPLPPAGEETARSPSLRILVVEDEADAREALRVELELEGHRVDAVADGPAALDRALRERPDVALVDIGLPGMDGYEVARRLRTALGPGIRLVALTAHGLAEDRREAREAGFDLHLLKPVSGADLIRALARRR